MMLLREVTSGTLVPLRCYRLNLPRCRHVLISTAGISLLNMQSCYNLLYREDERDLNIYCKKHKIALTPWSPNQRGILCRPLSKESDRSKTDGIIAQRHLLDLQPHEIEIVNRVEELAKKKGVSMANVSTAWVIAKGAMPIIGMSSIERVDDNIKALDVELTEEDLKYLEEPYKPRSFMW